MNLHFNLSFRCRK